MTNGPPAAPTDSAVHIWLAIHRELLDRENAFTDLAIRAAAGHVSTHELAQQRSELMKLRERCSAAYDRAFPKSTSQA